MEYIVSARKYRPATFDTVVGQRALTTTLLNAIRTNHLAHAYLFCGPRGVGKTTCARIFAKTINCLHPLENGEACQQCESCTSFDEGRSMNIHELDAASNNSVDDIRELIDQVRIPPQGGRYKVFIIDEVHMLSTAAFNAFLKTLEEPPHYVIFILATTEKHKILPTILSRCQVYDFARISLQSTVDHLGHVAEKEGVRAEAQALHLIAQKADGGMRDALSIFDQMASFTQGNITLEATLQNLNMLSADYYFRLVELLLRHKATEAMLLLDEVIGKGFDAGNFIAGLSTHLRNLLVARDAQSLPLLEVSDEDRPRYQQQAQQCPLPFIYNALQLCQQCDATYRQSRNKRLQVEITLIQLSQLDADDGTGSGLRPEKIIKPLFAALKEGGEATAPKAAENSAQPVSAPKAATTIQPHDAPTQQPTSAAASKPLRPRISLSNIAITATVSEPETTLTAAAQQATPPTTQQQPLTEDILRNAWATFLASLPENEQRNANRLRALQPQMLSTEGEFGIEVPNQLLLDELQQQRTRIEAHMRQSSGIPTLRMTLGLIPEDRRRVLTPAERLERMKEQSEGLRVLLQNTSMTII
ncbi:MAG: DNA polymerase III subunit gamma/tau [Bacteroidaceae bacterium]|nr:DNA polymerase III subunit gamma/tau [Bacteroidaceae bacterium]